MDLKRQSSINISLPSCGFPELQPGTHRFTSRRSFPKQSELFGCNSTLNRNQKKGNKNLLLTSPWSNGRVISEWNCSINSLFSVSFSQYSPAEWFLKPIFNEVPQRDHNPIFVGRDWLYRDVTNHLRSHLPTNCGVMITGTPGSGKTAIMLKLVENSCFGSGQSGLRGQSFFS